MIGWILDSWGLVLRVVVSRTEDLSVIYKYKYYDR